MKNRLINGDMRIDQRNAGASGAAVNTYTVDRWAYNASQAGKATWGQNLNAATPPVGFKNYLGFQSSSAYAVLTTDLFSFWQPVEGVNIADLNWGTANAKTITISFQVYSSLTGNFGGVVKNGSGTRSYPFLYSIPVANTWTYVTVTVPGDTSGTWATDTSVGLYMQFGLGVGSANSGTAGAWAGTNYSSATGAVSVVGTNAATFYVTGIQLEQAAVASPFEYLLYAVELALCQRYFETDFPPTTAPANNTIADLNALLAVGTTACYSQSISFKVPKRSSPSMSFYSGTNVVSPTAGRWGYFNSTSGWTDSGSATTLGLSTTIGFSAVVYGTFTNGASYLATGAWSANSEL
jgi:hypothetical protein